MADKNTKIPIINSKGKIAAVFVEPIAGSTGTLVPPQGYLQRLREICDEHGILLVFDEVITGFGRTGKAFASQSYGVTPDIITMAKGMGNGFPIGGILIHPDIKSKYGLLGTTFGGNHLACTASLSVLDVLKKERLQEKTKVLESYFISRAKKLPHISKIKGRGLMLGLEFDFEVSALRKELILSLIHI